MLRIQYHFAWESIMKKIAAVCVLAGSLAVAGPASAHGRDGGAVIGALIGGAVLGAIVTSAMNPPVAYQAPAYQQQAYPTYQQAQYQDDGPNYCYDRYQRAYVCGAPVQQGGYVQPAGW
ncbi:TPA: hypothetical protein ACT5CR_001638 [Burkholderia cenocepacia]|uniref:hypothetical protein n=1 Tax=Burkholderia cenocepacia TaxID=95486 RepID=UPI001BAD071A|nr:hypothetical protein [Burkholderia cenocepacia]QUN42437.1 hypothetical protein KEH56_24370 [Burkholderia cenocepacia]QUO26118.1 hypothetical protein KEH57_04070 [Burkholderia cenocepacia]